MSQIRCVRLLVIKTQETSMNNNVIRHFKQTKHGSQQKFPFSPKKQKIPIWLKGQEFVVTSIDERSYMLKMLKLKLEKSAFQVCYFTNFNQLQLLPVI